MAISKKILVTGGAGYIGSHTVKLLAEQGYEIIVLDNLSTGHPKAVAGHLIVGDLADKPLLNKIFSEYEIDAVIHFAGSLIVEESMLLPGKYFENNVVNGLNLLNVMAAHGVRKLVDSSSAAVYGEPHEALIDESHPKKPLNPYGESKLMFEKALPWYATAHQLSSVSLRYFNAAGASLDASNGEQHPMETHLIPRILQVAARQADQLTVYGNDYPTADGTCIRDYIHVVDLAQAHLLSLRKLDETEGCFAYNVGTGHGYSIAQVISAAIDITQKMIPIEYGPRRSGDPAVLVADIMRIQSELGFQPKHSDLNTIVSTAWAWHQKLIEKSTGQNHLPEPEGI